MRADELFERNTEIYKLHLAGMTYTDIAEKFNISRQRAKQIIDRIERRKNKFNKILESLGEVLKINEDLDKI